MSNKSKTNSNSKYKKEQINFIEKEKLEKYLSCPICQEIFDEPIRITCGHTFCRKCIIQWEKKSRHYQCPLCRDMYVPAYSGKDLLAQNMINDAYVTCIYKGCPWKEKFVELNNHIKDCLFNPKKLPAFMKITNWFKENENEKNIKTNKINKNEKENEENNEPLENSCTFNYTSSLKERVFSRNPNLVVKLFEKDKEAEKENIQEKKKQQNFEKISDNDEINAIYNSLIFDKNDIIKPNQATEKEKEKENINENEKEQKQSLHGSSIMNIFINPNINISSPDFLGNKTERDGK